MKRINPETGTFFKRGDTRPDDNKKFFGYKTSVNPDKNGFYYEDWRVEASFNKSIDRTAKYNRDMFASDKNYRAKKLVQSAKSRAYKTDGMVSIDTDWVNVRLMKGRCELTGLPFDLERSKEFSYNPYAPSIDRIDSENPNYVPENSRLVLSAVNGALNQFGEEVMLPILKAMVASIEKRQCETSSQNSLAA